MGDPPVTAISIQLPAKYLIIILIAYYPMSQQVEDAAGQFCVRCADVGLDCNYVIVSSGEKKVIDKTIVHMFEFHAVKPENDYVYEIEDKRKCIYIAVIG
jgi:predicted small metal-binding protein